MFSDLAIVFNNLHSSYIFLYMRKIKKDRSAITNCGGKKKGSCNTWAGATTLETKIKVAA